MLVTPFKIGFFTFALAFGTNNSICKGWAALALQRL